MIYVSITAAQAKHLMDTESDYVILDVRTEEEYNESHIPCAVLIPDYEITEMCTRELEQMIRRQPEIWLWSHKRWKHKRAVK